MTEKKLKALEKMMEEMNKDHTASHDEIHNWLCEQEDDNLFEKILDDGKSIKGAYNHCIEKAKKSEFAKNGGAMVPDETVYQWVIDYYFNEKVEKVEKIVKEKVNKEVKIKQPKQEKTQLSLFDL